MAVQVCQIMFLAGALVYWLPMGEDSRSKGRGFESSTWYCEDIFVKIALFVRKDRKEIETRPRMAQFQYKKLDLSLSLSVSYFRILKPPFSLCFQHTWPVSVCISISLVYFE